MADVAVDIAPRADRDGVTEKWLIEQVAPVLARVVTENGQAGNWSAYDVFADIIRRHKDERNSRKRSTTNRHSVD